MKNLRETSKLQSIQRKVLSEPTSVLATVRDRIKLILTGPLSSERRIRASFCKWKVVIGLLKDLFTKVQSVVFLRLYKDVKFDTHNMNILYAIPDKTLFLELLNKNYFACDRIIDIRDEEARPGPAWPCPIRSSRSLTIYFSFR